MKLTQTSIAKIVLPKGATDKIFFDDEMEGFGLRVRAGGSRKWVVHYRQGGTQRRHTLGLANVLTVEEARKKARKVLVAVDDGRDPVTEKATKRAASALIFSSVAADYLGVKQRTMKPRSHIECTRHINKHWKPLHGLALSAVSRPIIAARMRAIVENSGNIAANRARATLSAMFGWAIGEGLCDSNPVVGTNKTSEGTRDRVLTDAEMAAIWRATADNVYGRIVRLLMLTAQRRTEIGGLCWSEIDTDGKRIVLPPARVKNNRSHEVPLSDAALDVLAGAPRRAGRDLVFGGGMSGYAGWAKAKPPLDKASGIAGWTLHDLRRTAATRMADLGVQPHVIEAVLNHVSGHKSGVAGIYNRSTYANEKRAALDLWAGHLRMIVAQAEGANVHKLAAKGRP